MKVELHLHTHRHSLCAVNSAEEMMHRLIETGYQAVYLTEHDTIWPPQERQALQAEFPDIRIYSGVELSITSHHLLVLGTSDTEYLRIGRMEDVLQKARQEGHLTILAHPFRWEGAAEMLERGLRPDALECQTNNHTPEAGRMARRAAKKLSLPLVNAGDIHAMTMIDRFWIETTDALKSADDIRDIVCGGLYQNAQR